MAQQLQFIEMDLRFRQQFPQHDYNYEVFFFLESKLNEFLKNILAQDGRKAVIQITELLPG